MVAGDLQYGMARMTQILAERNPAELQIFRDLDEAYRWLGLEDKATSQAPTPAQEASRRQPRDQPTD